MRVAMLQRQVQMATNVAMAKDRLLYLGSFTATLAVVGAAKRSRAALVPVLPLSFLCAWHADMVYGNKLERVCADAERLLETDKERFVLPSNNGQ